MRIYAESSAVAAWLLSQAPDRELHEILAGADLVAASDLTLVECHRALVRASSLGAITESEAAERASALEAAAVHWQVVRIAGEVVERCTRPFPVEPVRALDAIHLSSALLARSALPGLQILSLDERVRENARALGFEIVPETP